jgi:hypothetical protein
MIAWTVSVEDRNEDYSKHTPFPSREVRPTVVTAPYYIPDEALMITRSQAHDFNWQNARHEAVVTAAVTSGVVHDDRAVM